MPNQQRRLEINEDDLELMKTKYVVGVAIDHANEAHGSCYIMQICVCVL